MSLPFAANIKRLKSILGNVLGKIVCVFDDIPFLLRKFLPKKLGSLGAYLLAGAGFIAFPLELYKSIQSFRKAIRLAPTVANRRFLIGICLAKILFASLGIAISSALIFFVIATLPVAEAGACVLIPATLMVISGIELLQKCNQLHYAKQTKNPVEIHHAKRKVCFFSTYFTCASIVTVCALLSTLGGLGVLSLGAFPSAMLIGVVTLALAVKIFEMIDKRHQFRYTNAIHIFFKGTKLVDLKAENFDYRQGSIAKQDKKTFPRSPIISNKPLSVDTELSASQLDLTLLPREVASMALS